MTTTTADAAAVSNDTLFSSSTIIICIWPKHCLIGTDGHVVMDNVTQTLQDWSQQDAPLNHLGSHLSDVQWWWLGSIVISSIDGHGNIDVLTAVLGP